VLLSCLCTTFCLIVDKNCNDGVYHDIYNDLSVSFWKPWDKYLTWAKKGGMGVRKEIEGEPEGGSCRNNEQNASRDRCVIQMDREETTREHGAAADRNGEQSVVVVVGGRRSGSQWAPEKKKLDDKTKGRTMTAGTIHPKKKKEKEFKIETLNY